MAFKFSIQSTQPTNDGTGDVVFDVIALDDNDNPIPGRHADFRMTSEDLNFINSAPNDGVKQNRLNATLIQLAPKPGWTQAELAARVNNNNAAGSENNDFTEWVGTQGNFPLDVEL